MAGFARQTSPPPHILEFLFPQEETNGQGISRQHSKRMLAVYSGKIEQNVNQASAWFLFTPPVRDGVCPTPLRGAGLPKWNYPYRPPFCFRSQFLPPRCCSPSLGTLAHPLIWRSSDCLAWHPMISNRLCWRSTWSLAALRFTNFPVPGTFPGG